MRAPRQQLEIQLLPCEPGQQRAAGKTVEVEGVGNNPGSPLALCLETVTGCEGRAAGAAVVGEAAALLDVRQTWHTYTKPEHLGDWMAPPVDSWRDACVDYLVVD